MRYSKFLLFAVFAVGLTLVGCVPDGDDTEIERTTSAPSGSVSFEQSEDTEILKAEESPLTGHSSLGRIAYASDRDGDTEIYVADLERGTEVQLTNNESADGDPTWSPDGRHIAYVSDRRGNYGIFLVDEDGSNDIRLTSEQYDSVAPIWSPDGKYILYTRRVEYQYYLIDVESGEERPLTKHDYDTRKAVWSPDSTRVALTVVGDDTGYDQIYIVDVLTGTSERLTTNDLLDYNRPAWSPDGTRIACIRYRGLIVIDLETGKELRLTNSEFRDGDPIWSPDGFRIVHASDRDGTDRSEYDLYVIDVESRTESRLTYNGGFGGDPVWSPDGESIAYSTDFDGDTEIYVVGVESGIVQQLTSNIDGDTAPSWTR